MSSQLQRREESGVVSLSYAGATEANRSFFLRTKLLLPNAAVASLPRPRLIERLAANSAHPVTLVMANAGSGKTTLVADFVRSQTQSHLWYQLDHTDADPAVFLGYIVHGMRQITQGFGQATLDYLRQEAAEVNQHPERAVDMLISDLFDRIDEEMILVLDDYHSLGSATKVHVAVERLLAYLPDVMRVIITSREALPLHLAKQRSQSTLAIIDSDDLLFTDEEMQAFFRQVFDVELTPQQLAECRERTQGWGTALQFVRQVAQQKTLKQAGGGCPATIVTDLTAVLHQSEQEAYHYFAEEVFVREEKQIQYLLMRLSLLKRIELETCEQLHPAANCAVILPALVRRNVFISIAGNGYGEEYRLHPLFRYFLRRRLLEEIGREGVTAEQAHIAYYFVKRGKWAPAIRHLLEAEEFDRAARVIAEKGQTGQTLINSGALKSLMRSEEISASPTPHKSAGAQTAVITPEPSFDLTIKLIGSVEIYRDPQQPFATGAWTTRRARDIFCFIASLWPRRVSKETIIDTFWGETDLKTVLKNFNPTLSHSRKALNSNQSLKKNFLIYRDGDFMLDPRFSYSIDTEEFDRLVAEAEAARRAGQRERQISFCESAVALYRGEFMQGCFDDWSLEQQSYYREQYQSMLKTLTLAAQEAREWSRSLQLAHKILKDDPFCEEIHCLAMRAYAAEGNRLAVKKQYLFLRRMLHKELGVEPSEETKAVYFRLLG